jgi:hypothetical protein
MQPSQASAGQIKYSVRILRAAKQRRVPQGRERHYAWQQIDHINQISPRGSIVNIQPSPTASPVGHACSAPARINAISTNMEITVSTVTHSALAMAARVHAELTQH